MQPTCSIAADKGKLLREGQLSISNSLPHRAQVFTSEQLVKLVKFIFKVPEQGSLFILKQVTHPSSIRDSRFQSCSFKENADFRSLYETYPFE